MVLYNNGAQGLGEYPWLSLFGIELSMNITLSLTSNHLPFIQEIFSTPTGETL